MSENARLSQCLITHLKASVAVAAGKNEVQRTMVAAEKLLPLPQVGRFAPKSSESGRV
jgi:hypothetical protein